MISKHDIHLNGKRFKSVNNSSNGEVSSDTVFVYSQYDNLISAEYSGGQISAGHLIGTISSKGILEFAYHHVNQSMEIMVGECISTPEILLDGRLRFHERWQWLNGDRSVGDSIIEEII